jgi:hypothetical protein
MHRPLLEERKRELWRGRRRRRLFLWGSGIGVRRRALDVSVSLLKLVDGAMVG